MDPGMLDLPLSGIYKFSHRHAKIMKKFPIDKKQQNSYYGFTAFNKNRQNPTKDGS
jgi:hypothetical protein